MLGAPLQPQPILGVGKISERHKVPDPLYMFSECCLQICDDGHVVFSRRNTTTAEFTNSILKPPVHGAPSLTSQDGTARTTVGYPTDCIFRRAGFGVDSQTMTVLKHFARLWPYIFVAVALFGLAYKIWAGEF